MGALSPDMRQVNTCEIDRERDCSTRDGYAALQPQPPLVIPSQMVCPLREYRRPLLQIAPMMEVTYRDFRHFVRLLSSQAELWTEMVVANTLIKAERVDGWLDYGFEEHPIVFQLGGSCPSQLAEAAKMAEDRGYDQVNLNCGCPSDKVSGKGEFGASLMKRPELVHDCVKAMTQAVNIPVTVKCRLGCDDLDTPEFTADFVRTVAAGGVRHFIIHARKCLLNGLTPTQNRTIPPLMYDRVFRLCKEFPDLDFTLNGGVTSLEQLKGILEGAPSNLVGVMIGRAAHANPCILADADRYLYGEPSNPPAAISRRAALLTYCQYLDEMHPPGGDAATSSSCGGILGALKPIIGLFNGVRGNKLYRQALDKFGHDRELRVKGPGAVVRRVVAALEEDKEGALVSLDEPLKPAGLPQREGPGQAAAPTQNSSLDGNTAEKKLQTSSPSDSSFVTS